MSSRVLSRSFCAVVVLGVFVFASAAAGGTTPGLWAYKYGTKYASRASGPLPAGLGGGVHAASVTSGGWPRAGEYPQYSFFSQTLDDRMQVQVNLESGNLLLEADDAQLAGVAGFDFDAVRIYNSLQQYATDTYGAGWNLSLGSTVGLNVFSDHVDYFTPGGDYATFTGDGSGPYASPPGMDATLTKTQSGFSLAWRDHVTDYFDSLGLWLYREDSHLHGTPAQGNRISFSYQYLDGYHQTLTATDSRGRVISFTVDPSSGMTTQMSFDDPACPSGTCTWSYTYNGSKQLTSASDPAGEVTRYEYDSSSDLTKITDPDGNVTTISYDSQDRVTSLTRQDPVNGDRTWTFVYNDGASPQTTVMTDPNSHVWTYTRGNGDGTIVATKDPLGRSTATTYTANGDVASSTDEAGGTTDNTWASSANSMCKGAAEAVDTLCETQGPAPSGSPRQTTSYLYTNAANPYSPSVVSDPNGDGWQFSYSADSGDLLGKAEGSSGAGQNPVSFTYNPDGTLATATDARGKEWTYGYTNENLTSITPPAGATVGATSASYDSLNRLSCETDGNHDKTCYGYDPLGRVTTVTSYNPDGSTFDSLTYSYDGDGNVTAQTDSSGTIHYSYDALNELSEETHPGPQTTGYSYDGVGNLLTLADESGTTSYSYDAAGRLTAIAEPEAPNDGTISYSYPDELHTTISYPNGASVASTYDTAGRLVALTDKDGTGATVADYSYSYAYSAAGVSADGSLRRSVTDNGSTTYYCYDPVGRLASAGSQSDCPTSGPAWGNPNAAYQYQYDATGNMTTRVANGSTTYYSYQPANEICYAGPTPNSPCDTSFAFDADGNQTAGPATDNGWSFAYNPLNQTTATNQFSGTSYQGQGQAQRTLFDDWTFSNDQLGLASRTSPSSETLSYFTRDPSGTVLAIRENYNHNGYHNSYLLFDGLGSVIAKTNDQGTLTGQYSYDPYGNTTSTTDTPGSTLNPYHYADMYQDSTGLYKTANRYYDPTIARWTQRDPINNPLDEHGWNPYNYAGDDPVNETDPSGLLSRTKCYAACLAAWAAVVGKVSLDCYNCAHHHDPTACAECAKAQEHIALANEALAFCIALCGAGGSPSRGKQKQRGFCYAP